MSTRQIFKLTYKYLLLTIYLLLTLAVQGQAITYYVTTDGSDSNDGSLAAPFRTIQHAADIVMPGDQVLVKAGTYYERIEVKTSGSPGNPIIFEGEHGPNGDFLTIIDGGESTTGWTVWEEGSEYRIWKTTNLPSYTPGNMVWRDKQVPQHRFDDRDGLDDRFTYLRSPLSFIYDVWYCGTAADRQIRIWDVLNVFWTLKDGSAYIRFKDKNINPNSEDLRWSGLYRGQSYDGIPAKEGTVLFIQDKGYNTFRNFKLQAASHPVFLSGNGAHHNIIEECYLQNGTDRVNIQRGASYNKILNSTLTMNFSGLVQPGAWHCGNLKNEFIYIYFKGIVSECGSSDNNNILIEGAGEGNEIEGNHIYGALIAIAISSTKNLKIHNNVIHGHSSGSISWRADVVEIEFYDNLFYDSGAWIFRRTGEDDARRMYIYRNRFYVAEDFDYEHLYATYYTADYGHNDYIYIYQNSFSGGGPIFNAANSPGPNSYDNHYFFNNIFAADGYGFNADWAGAVANNLSGSNFWDNSQMPDFTIPANSPARNSGIDLSQPFTANGKSFPALPGMETGYGGSDGKPDLGALQYGQSPEDVPPREEDDAQPPSMPTNVRASTISEHQIDLSWSPSNDNVGVSGYYIYRDGNRIADVYYSNYSDMGLTPSTTYSYTVSAFDYARNESVQSTASSANTFAVDEPVYTIIKAVVSPIIDGNLEEYTHASAINFSLSTGNNQAIVKALWDTEALYLGYKITDNQLDATETNRDGQVWEDDGVEWFIDTQNNDGGILTDNVYMLADDYHGIVNILNTQYDSQGTSAGTPSTGWNGTWKTAIVRNDTANYKSNVEKGYSVEIKIPWTSIRFNGSPLNESTVGMSFAVNDRDGASFNTMMWPNISESFENVANWQQILLSGKTVDIEDTVAPNAPTGLKTEIVKE